MQSSNRALSFRRHEAFSYTIGTAHSDVSLSPVQVEEAYHEAERNFSEINNELHTFLPEFYDGFAERFVNTWWMNSALPFQTYRILWPDFPSLVQHQGQLPPHCHAGLK